MIGVLDTGSGNVRSVTNALDRMGVEYTLSGEAQTLSSCEKIIFPGVGHARAVMEELHRRSLVTFLQRWERPLLGICLGMQLLFDRSAEGDTPCLGIIPGEVLLFDQKKCSIVPHIGWNDIEYGAGEALFHGLSAGVLPGEGHRPPREGELGTYMQSCRSAEGGIPPSEEPTGAGYNPAAVYFVHSYYVPVGASTIARAECGTQVFSAAVRQGNIHGVQFHPEKSGDIGERLLHNFISLS